MEALIRLSAYSTTTIAPSTNIPTARIKPNITMFDIAMPITDINAKHNRNDVGIAKPTSNADLIPKDANTTIITSAIAVRTELSSCPTMPSTSLDKSMAKFTLTLCLSSSGQSFLAANTFFLTVSTVSIMFDPLRWITCKATVFSPLNRAVPVRSSKVSLIFANSPSVTILSPFTLTGKL